MDDMSASIELRGLSSKAYKALRRKAAAADQTPEDYLRAQVEALLDSEETSTEEEVIAHNEKVFDQIARHREHLTSEVTIEDVLAALREGRGE